MTAIPNTIRRGAIYWFRRSRRLPDGKIFRPTVSLRTACSSTARVRAAILSARFEELYMRLFGKEARRYSVDAEAARRIFQREFNLALDAIEDEREQATLSRYPFIDFPTFLEVHEEIYRYLAEKGCTRAPTMDELAERLPDTDPVVLGLLHRELQQIPAFHYQDLDDTAAVLEADGIETDIFFMDHASRLRFEARIAAVQEFRQALHDPAERFRRLLAPVASTPRVLPSAPANYGEWQVAAPRAPIPSEFANLTAQEFASKYIEDNPKLSESGKRGGKWTAKTRTQFESAMRLLEKSMGSKPFAELHTQDLKRLLAHFDSLPPNHHKSPRHNPMTLDEICTEAQVEIREGRLDPSELGLNVPTLQRHFRFIRMAHEWLRKQVKGIAELDWQAFAFEDDRPARDQRKTFPVDLARKLFRLPPWHGCAGVRHRFKPGREIYSDSFFWVIPIVWYSGMRREEACKLLVTDIAQDADGLWYFDVDDTEAGRIKTTSSRRQIPFAEELIRLGLPEFVAAQRGKGEALLFPELTKTNKGLGETFYRHCWKKLMPLLEADTAGLSLHSIRHTVADELKAAGVPEEVRADLLGHVLETETAGRYSKASRLAILKNAVDQIPCATRAVHGMIPSTRQP